MTGEEDFVETSCQLARHLQDSQTGSASSGLLVVVRSGSPGNAACF